MKLHKFVDYINQDIRWVRLDLVELFTRTTRGYRADFGDHYASIPPSPEIEAFLNDTPQTETKT